MTYLEYPAMVPSIIGDHGLFRLSSYGLSVIGDYGIFGYPAMVSSAMGDHALFRLSCYDPLSHR
jgi:hypothetical protein